ncbi:hypothetical protein PPROV_000485900 [Pycnococcus provasolii]|uniref:SNF2 super family n=1 Tax=Pycnococcus provasolii TaxID=41880 RepID=A0A830HH49_9CHLO|nr:hypothetical protein PPROV_000485900 [Pycnococcus provasolii]
MTKGWVGRSRSPSPEPDSRGGGDVDDVDVPSRHPDASESAFLASLQNLNATNGALGGVGISVKSHDDVAAQIQRKLQEEERELALAQAQKQAQKKQKTTASQKNNKNASVQLFDAAFDAAFASTSAADAPQASHAQQQQQQQQQRKRRLGLTVPVSDASVPDAAKLATSISRAGARTAAIESNRARTTMLPASSLPAPPPQARPMHRPPATGAAASFHARQAEAAAKIAAKQRKEREAAMARVPKKGKVRTATATAKPMPPPPPPLRAAATAAAKAAKAQAAAAGAVAFVEKDDKDITTTTKPLPPPPPPIRAAAAKAAKAAAAAFAAIDEDDEDEDDEYGATDDEDEDDEEFDEDDNDIDFEFASKSKNKSKSKSKSSPSSPSSPPSPFLPPGGGADNITLLDESFSVPKLIWDKLFRYQQTGVQWLCELHAQRSGGIVGDEMGLGKTVQICAFFAALHRSGLYKPSLVVCPATVMEQWRDELVKWTGGLFHVCILHASADRRGGAGAGNRQEDEDEEEEQFARGALVANPSGGVRRRANNSGRVKRLKQALRSTNTVVITTYDMVRAMRDHLIPVRWGYVVLDEGHKIRNPDADITITCKCLRTVHRTILSGAPIQNHLTELWSLFDFVFPGRLGTLPVFQAQYAIPIQIGGYTNATPLQVQTAYQCSVSLRDLVTPYLLRRMKCDVMTTAPDEGGGSGGDKQHDIDDSKDGGMDKMDKIVLPKKTEQVLFCSLTPVQLQAYRSYLASKECSDILEEDDLNIDPDRRKSRRRKLLAGIDTLRKVCNHPDLLDRVASVVSNDPDYGNVERSGKLTVLDKILQEWHSKGHRCLVFTQTQQMLDIIERHVFEKHGETFQYRRMDGSTAVDRRAGLMAEFNAPDSGIFLFLLTTRVGGLGTNLIGADRVVIFDPDWNPSTDIQARERAWRIGQTKDVTIYRLITTGTIEEKVYHRQIYKSLLTEKVLRDPKQKRLFSSRDLRDLFSLGAEYENVPIKSAATQVAESSMHAMRGGGGLETMQIFGEAMEDHRKAQAVQPSDSSAAAAAAAAPMLDAWGDYDYDGEYDDLLPPPGDEEEMDQDALLPKDNPQPPEPSKETAILDELLRSSIAGAVDHDAVVGAGLDCGDGNGSGGGDVGRRLGLRAEAARSARLAAQAVQKSSSACAKSGGVHVPTWTGRAGSAGAPGSRFGAVGTGASVARVGSSAEGCAAGTTPIGIGSGGILAQIRARANASKNAGAM